MKVLLIICAILALVISLIIFFKKRIKKRNIEKIPKFNNFEEYIIYEAKNNDIPNEKVVEFFTQNKVFLVSEFVCLTKKPFIMFPDKIIEDLERIYLKK